MSLQIHSSLSLSSMETCDSGLWQVNCQHSSESLVDDAEKTTHIASQRLVVPLLVAPWLPAFAPGALALSLRLPGSEQEFSVILDGGVPLACFSLSDQLYFIYPRHSLSCRFSFWLQVPYSVLRAKMFSPFAVGTFIEMICFSQTWISNGQKY